MKEIPKITDAEMLVMKTLWESSPLTTSEIVSTLKMNTSWSPTTIQTLVSRLVKKGAVDAIKESHSYKYVPVVEEEQYEKEETISLIEKVYDGSLKLFMKSFISNVDLSDEDIDELKRMLDEKKDK